MKKIFVALICITLFISSFAANKDIEKDITLVSYEQSWSDSQGTLSLKNNTSEEIKNVVFLITYMDMSGTELDYKEFSKSVVIAPGMTKKLDIEAYEHDRNYHYYKSQGLYDNTSFKIKFQLQDYNVDNKDIRDTIGITSSSFWIYTLIAMIFIIGISIGVFVLVAVMAKKRNRSVVLWLLLSFIATPFLIIIILLCIGKDERNPINKGTLS